MSSGDHSNSYLEAQLTIALSAAQTARSEAETFKHLYLTSDRAEVCAERDRYRNAIVDILKMSNDARVLNIANSAIDNQNDR